MAHRIVAGTASLRYVTIHADNPAGRLHQLMSRVRAKPDGQNVPRVWGEILGVGDDWPELLRLFAFVAGLPKEILGELDHIDRTAYPVELARRWHGPINEAPAVDFARGVQIHHVKAKFDGESLAYLELCDDVLHRHRRGISPDQPDLGRIRAKIGDLRARPRCSSGHRPRRA